MSLFRRVAGSPTCHREKSGNDTGLFVVDLDHFKQVNDQFGYQAGDAVLIKRIQEPIAFEGFMLSVGASIGMAFGKKIGINPRVLLKAAEQALYKVKQSGRNAANF